MTSNKEDRGDLCSLLQRLAQTAHRTDADDLGGLAKMHTWCEALGEGGEMGGQIVPGEVIAEAKEIAGLLEGMILGEAKDPEAALASVLAKVTRLLELAGSPSESAVSRHLQPPGEQLGQEQVAEKLARIFEPETAAP